MNKHHPHHLDHPDIDNLVHLSVEFNNEFDNVDTDTDENDG